MRRVLLLGLATLIAIKSFSQANYVPAPPAPTVAGILKYGDIPVDLHNGTANISVPIYEIVSGQLHLPIALNYHPSGIRVDENSGNVGLGWTLSAEGILTRTILGQKDNGTYQANSTSYDGVALNPNIQADLTRMSILGHNGTDGVPDLYSYSFAGNCGKFIEPTTGYFSTMPQTNISIQRYFSSTNAADPHYAEWKIVTEDGTQYYFDDSMEITASSSDFFLSENSDTWYLTKIISANNLDTIRFFYTRTILENIAGRSATITSWHNCSFNYDMCSFAPCITYIPVTGPGVIHDYQSTTIGRQLYKIEFRNGTIEYKIGWNTRSDCGGYGEDPDHSTSYRVPEIDKIIIKNKNGEVVKAAHMLYGNFNEGLNDGERLKLTSVVLNANELSFTTPDAQSYSFSYNSVSLPTKHSNALDHWGFYNGHNENITLIPTTTVGGITYSGANREPSENYMKAGSLERITYPSGGYTQFDFEPHTIPPSTPFTSVLVDSLISISFSFNSVFPYVHYASDEADAFYVDPARFPTGLTATFSGSCTPPSPCFTADFTDGDPRAQLLEDGVGIISSNFIYLGDYSYSAEVTLESGHSYAIRAVNARTGFSTIANLNLHIPHLIPNPEQIIGGLRIKQITNHDQYTNSDNVKKYQYNSGQVFALPQYVSTVYDIEQCPIDYSGALCIAQYRTGNQISSISKQTIGSGDHVMYSWVKETNGNEAQGGYSMYHYTNFSDESRIGEIDQTWKRGLLLDKTDYDNIGNMVHKTVNTYSADVPTWLPFYGEEYYYIAENPCDGGIESSQHSFFGARHYFFPSEWWHIDVTKDSLFYPSGIMTQKKEFIYDNSVHKEVTRVYFDLSDGTEMLQRLTYPADYTLEPSPSTELLNIWSLHNVLHIDNTPIEQVTFKKDLAGNFNAISGNFTEWHSSNAGLQPAGNYILRTTAPIGSFLMSQSDFATGTVAKNSNYVQERTFGGYDERGNAIDVWTIPGYFSCIYFYNEQYLAAIAKNASIRNIAYTGFETSEMGNWSLDLANIVDDHITGNKAYRLDGGIDWFPPAGCFVTPPPPSIPNYIVSYWKKDGDAITVNGTLPIITGNTVNGWTYYEHVFFTGGAVTLAATGASPTIDELRLYPVNAQMETYTYDPLKGMTAKCDVNNLITYYEYDNVGRLKLERDAKGNIIKKYEYGIQKTEY